MINRDSATILLVVVTFFIVAGCEQQQQQQQQQQQKEELSPHIPAYITQVVEKAGGLEAWDRTIKLESDCVVTFYQPDGSFNLTKQHHEIYPWSHLIRISAQEPQGKFLWEFSQDGIMVIEGTKQEDFGANGLGTEDFAKAILDITTAPVQLLQCKAGLMRGSSAVRIEGRWVYRIDQVGVKTGSEPYWPNRVFYQNIDSSLVDMLWFTGIDRGTFLAVRGYYYREVEKGGVVVPAKIEIFLTDVQGVIQHRLVKIDYHRLKAAK